MVDIWRGEKEEGGEEERVGQDREKGERLPDVSST